MPLEGTFEFAHPNFLYLLIPAFLLLFLSRREGAGGSIAFGSLMILGRLGKKPGGRVGLLGSFIFFLALAAGVIGLARPQLVNEKEYTTTSGIDILIAFDLSTSMSESYDMAVNRQRTNRLTAAKLVVSEFITHRKDDRIGLVGFSARPKIFSPLTLDHALIHSQIERMVPQMMQMDGTAIGSALAAASSRLEERKDTKSKIIILVTDGASNSGELSPIEAAKLAAKLGIKIYTIAVGREDAGGVANFDENTLQQIAKLTGGEHFRARDTQMFVNAFDSINRLEKSEAKHHIVRKEHDLFPWLVALAAALTTLGALVEITRRRPAP